MVRLLVLALLVSVLAVVAACALADDPATFDQRYAVVATDSSGHGGPVVPFQGPQFFEPLRTAWWYNYTPYMNSQYVPGMRLFWPGYQRLYMYWRAVATTSDASIQQHARDAKAADPSNTIWFAMSNEPNDLGQANQSGASFAPIYLKHHKNLRIGDPTCKIMGPGILNWAFQSTSCYQTGKAWYEEFRNAWAANPDCVAYSQSVNGTNYPPQDAFCMHPYDLRGQSPVPWVNDDWRWCRDQMIACHDDLQTYPETQGLSVWNTEYGGLKSPGIAQAADMMSGLTLWMREQPWVARWFLFLTYGDKYSGYWFLHLFDENGAINQLGKAYADLSRLPMDASFYHVPFHATWDQGADYTRSQWNKSTDIAEDGSAPGYKLSLTNGVAYTANTMRGRKYTPASGCVYRVRFNYVTNYDNNSCYLAMDTPLQTSKWAADAFGVSSDYVDIDLSSDPVASVSFGLFIRNSFTYPNATGDWRGAVSNLMLLTCPYPPTVTDAGAMTLDNTLSVHWTQPSGGKQPITEYEYAIGTSAKGTDVVEWTSAGSTASFSRDDLGLVDDTTYYVSVRAKDAGGNWGGIGCSDGIRKIRSVSVAGAKMLPTNTYAGLDGRIVSGVFPDSIYVQEPDRSAGVRVMGSFAVQPGYVVSVGGTSTVESKEFVLKSGSLLSSAPGTEPGPVFGSNKALGGGAVGLQPATIDSAGPPSVAARGLSPIGTIVRTAGKVTYVDEPAESYIYVDDGSKLTDGSGHAGMRVSLAYGPVPLVGANAVLTGCLGATDVSGSCARYLRPRSASDVSYDQVLSYLRNAGFEASSYAPWVYTGTGGGIRSGTWTAGVSAHSGSRFFGASGYNTTCSGRLVQTASLPAGAYRASVWSWVYHTNGDPTAAQSRIGIDPTGGTDPNSPNVVWSAWDTQSRTSPSQWLEISTPSVAVAGVCTVFLQYSQQFTSGYHINCFDDVTLISVP